MTRDASVLNELLNVGSVIGLFLIAFSYIFLPVILMSIGKLRRGLLRVDPNEPLVLPKIGVVVAAHNEQEVIVHLLESCLALDYPADRLRVFIGDDGSSDATVPRIRSFADSRICCRAYPERRGKSSVINDLMADDELRSFDPSVTLFCDAKSVLSQNAARAIAASFADPEVGCVALKLRMVSEEGKAVGEGLYWKYEMRLKALEDNLGCVMGCNGGGFGMRTALFEPISPGIIVEDLVLSLQTLMKGYRICFAHNAQVEQPACADVKSEWLRKVRIGAGNFQALGPCAGLLNPFRGVPSLVFWGHKVLRWFTPILLALVWACDLAALATVGGFARIAHEASLSLGVFVALSAILCWLRPSGAGVPTILKLAGYFGLMNFALVIGLVRFLRRTQQVTWDKADRAWSVAKGQA